MVLRVELSVFVVYRAADRQTAQSEEQSLTARQTDRQVKQTVSECRDRQTAERQPVEDGCQTVRHLLTSSLLLFLLCFSSMQQAGRLAGRGFLLLLRSVNASSGVSQEGGREEGEAETQQTAEEEEESSEDSEGANAANCPAEDERERGGRACIT